MQCSAVQCSAVHDDDPALLQLLQLRGDLPSVLAARGVVADLEAVQYSTRFVLGMFYNSPVDLGVDWAVKYVSSHPVVRYMAVDNLKRGQEGGETSVMVHSSVKWAEQEKEQSLEQAKVKLLQAVRELYPDWPQPKEVKSLRWLYSQVQASCLLPPASCLLPPAYCLLRLATPGVTSYIIHSLICCIVSS